MADIESHANPNPVSGLTLREETVSSLIQACGFLLGLGGVTVLIVKAALGGDPWTIVGVSIYGGSLLALYFASSLYHSVRRVPLKRGLKVLDHIAIYLLIAGTYTPFTLGPRCAGRWAGPCSAWCGDWPRWASCGNSWAAPNPSASRCSST